MNKKKLLLIFFRPPFPLLSGGQIRMYQNLRLLSKYFDVDVLFMTEDKVEDSTVKEIEKLATNVFWHRFTKLQYYFNTVRGFFSKMPLQSNYFYSKKIQKWIDKNISNYDIAFCNTIRTTKYLANKDIYKVIDFVDAISMNYEKAYEKKRFGLWKFLYYIDKTRLKKYEQEVLETFDKSIIISKVDKHHILEFGSQKKIKVIPNCVFPDIINNGYYIPEKNKISFVGKMNYEPNESAVTYFVEKIFPKVLEKNPNIEFDIMGVYPTQLVKNLEHHKNVNVLGYVEDLEREIKQSKIVVAPMISGAGVQNKILQAMYLEKCVVTSNIGAQGLKKISDSEIVIENNPLKFAEKINYYLANEEERIEIGKKAKKYIQNTFSEEEVDKLLREYLIE